MLAFSPESYLALLVSLQWASGIQVHGGQCCCVLIFGAAHGLTVWVLGFVNLLAFSEKVTRLAYSA